MNEIVNEKLRTAGPNEKSENMKYILKISRLLKKTYSLEFLKCKKIFGCDFNDNITKSLNKIDIIFNIYLIEYY